MRRQWTPEEEEREFQSLASDHYLTKCLERRTDADVAVHRTSADTAVRYARRTSGSALDVGAGEGLTTVRLQELGFDAVGVERSPGIAARAPDGLVVVGNAESLPVESSSQDLVVCNSILEHVLHPDRVIAEVSRVLRPGGVCVLTTTNRWHPTTGEINIPLFPYLPGVVRDVLWQRSGRAHISPHYFTYRQLRQLAAAHGMTCDTALDILFNEDPRRRKLVFRVASWFYGLPGGRWALEALVSVTKVRLTAPNR